jgi:hypothetical protein
MNASRDTLVAFLAMGLLFSSAGPHASAGALSGAYEVLAAASTVNLTAEGTIDWAQWGRLNADDFNHRADVASQISDFQLIGQGPVLQFGDNFTGYSWSNGTPVAQATGVTAGIYVVDEGNGFELTVPADATVKTLKVYVGAYAAQMRFEASLSDGSAPPYIDESFQNPSDGPNRAYVLNFAADSPGQTLTVRFTVLTFLGGSANVTLQAAALREGAPIVELLQPVNGTIYHPASGSLQFRASTISPKSIPPEQVRLTLNGVDVSSDLTLSGSATSRTAEYAQLQTNQLYQGTIIVTDNDGQAATNRFTFDTFSYSGTVVIEAEDYNFFDGASAGGFMDNPAPNAYLDFSGQLDTDYHTGGLGANPYRPADFVTLDDASDQVRPPWVDTGLPDYQLTALENGDWFNYTRTFPTGNFVVYLRYASLEDQAVRLDLITSDPAMPDPALRPLGRVRATRTGNENSYRYATLSDAFGTPLSFPFSGEESIRLTALDVEGGFEGLRLNFLLFAPSEMTGPRLPYVVAVQPTPGSSDVAPDAGIQITLAHGDADVAPSTINLNLDGTDVTSAATINPTPEEVTIDYRPSAMWPVNSTHAVTLVFADASAGAPTLQTNTWTFTVANLPTIPASFRTPPGSGRDPGLNLRVAKAPNDSDPALFTNSAARAELQLAGQLLDPNTGEPFFNEAAGPDGDGTYAESATLNYQQDGLPVGYFDNDLTVPGIAPGDPDFFALEATTYLELSAGLHRFGVRSDDGFRLATGASFTNATLELAAFEGGRGSALPDGSTEFEFLVEVPGLYAFRLLWYEGTGDADLEWFSVDRSTLGSGDVMRTLINDAGAGAVKAFQTRMGAPSTGPTPPRLGDPALAAGMFSTSFPTEAGFTYELEFKSQITDAAWSPTGAQTAGDGSPKSLSHANAAVAGFYRVVVR